MIASIHQQYEDEESNHSNRALQEGRYCCLGGVGIGNARTPVFRREAREIRPDMASNSHWVWTSGTKSCPEFIRPVSWNSDDDLNLSFSHQLTRTRSVRPRVANLPLTGGTVAMTEGSHDRKDPQDGHDRNGEFQTEYGEGRD
jgi:hypothetical protein